ncbi:MAG: nicotinate (nicotinamide) nucleotide adenylyltransferase [Huintestinicola sp.]
MNIVLFGGSFDPVHNGHINVVRSLLGSEDIRPDKVIIMPAAVSPFKQEQGARADGTHRIEMCRLAFSDIPCCEVSSYEIEKGSVSYTIDTVEHLKRSFGGGHIILALGSDSLRTLPKWHRYKDIIKNAAIAAVSRSEADSAEIERCGSIVRRDGGKVFVINAKPVCISSTEIRKKIINSEDISCYMPQNVVEYILNEKLYLY